MYFKHISAKIQPKNPKLVHFYFLAVRGDIRLEGVTHPLATPLLEIMSFWK